MWIRVDNTVIDVERYRFFRLVEAVICGLCEYEMGDERIVEPIAVFATDEQAEEAFERFADALLE